VSYGVLIPLMRDCLLRLDGFLLDELHAVPVVELLEIDGFCFSGTKDDQRSHT
jgi:hypothetical protein